MNKLPRHYWLFMVLWLLSFFVLGVALGVVSDINPYIMGSIISGLALLHEVYTLKRKGL